jgi:hypothetical protein
LLFTKHSINHQDPVAHGSKYFFHRLILQLLIGIGLPSFDVI